uniref:DUF3800 domain-containing protein n=1 Tax=Rhodopseudomonas palustris (strain BisA53) TaxID=316055 RepID=Q07TI0_RHOP5
MNNSDTPSCQLSNKTIESLTELANNLAWKQPNLSVLKPEFSGQYPPIAELLQHHLFASEERRRLVLPNLRAFNNETVAVFTDYGGETKGASYSTYSILVCGWNLKEPFLRRMKEIRHNYCLGTKEIAFKDFRMGQIQRALPDYLAALNNLLPGFLFTLAIDRRLTSIFGAQGRETKEFIANALARADLGERKAEVNEKLLRIVHLTAFLVGLLAQDGQRIFWMTDHDSISPTPSMHEKTLRLFQSVLGLYARKGHHFPLLGGALPFAERSLDTLDLLSAPDIVAGCIEQYVSQMHAVPPHEIKVKQGCDRVLQWLAHDGVGLKKMNMIMRPGKSGGIEAVTFEFGLETPPTDAVVIPVSM